MYNLVSFLPWDAMAIWITASVDPHQLEFKNDKARFYRVRFKTLKYSQYKYFNNIDNSNNTFYYLYKIKHYYTAELFKGTPH